MTNFNAIVVPTIEGTEQTISVKKELGNALYYQSRDVAGSELGRKIYLSEGGIELTDDEKKMVKDILPQVYAFVVRKAIEDAL